MRPQHGLRRIAIKSPIALCTVLVFQLVDLVCVLNLRSQQIAVLIPNLRRSSLQMDIGPAILLEFISAFQAVILMNGRLRDCGNGAETQRQSYYTNPATTREKANC